MNNTTQASQDSLTRERFQALQGETVTLCVGETELSAIVQEVNGHNRHGDAKREPFSVVFVTDSPDNHGQQIFTLKHDSLEALDLFLVPLGPKGDGMSYEAVVT